MPVRPIVLYPQAVLRGRACTVTDFGPALRRLCADMLDTMRAADGVGLAAPQVGVPLRVLVHELDGRPGHLVNPELSTFGPFGDDEEGCLSIPDVFGVVRRPAGVRVTGQDLDGRAVVLEDETFLARVIQHEVDHLNGVLFLDRLRGRERRRAFREVRRSAWLGEESRSVDGPTADVNGA